MKKVIQLAFSASLDPKSLEIKILPRRLTYRKFNYPQLFLYLWPFVQRFKIKLACTNFKLSIWNIFYIYNFSILEHIFLIYDL